MADLILVPLDATEKDARALAVAAGIAELANADVQLVTVHESSGAIVAPPELGAFGAGTFERRGEEVADLAETAADFATDTGLRVTSAVIDGGDVAARLIHHAVERDAGVLVMATRASRPAERVLLGSVADRVMRESPRPVILVPPGSDYLAGKHVHFGRVLVPLDGSPLAARAVDFVLTLCRARPLELVLLEVIPPGGDLRDAEVRLDAAAARARGVGARAVEITVVESDDPSGAIAAAVRQVLVEMIAMSTRGQSGLRRLMLGSVAEGVVRGSEVPLLLLTPTSLAEPA